MKKEHEANIWMYNKTVRCASKKSLPFEFTKEDLMKITDLPCMYCGEQPTNYVVSCIDRIRPELGFTRTNTVPACNNCIRAKSSCTATEFIQRCLHISFVHGSCGAKTDNWRNIKYKSYENYKAENSHKNFKLTEEDYYALRNGKCTYCSRETTEKHMNGIDRIDPNLGYILSNCETCCHDCNLMKLVSSKEEFLNLVKKVSSHVMNI